MKPITKHISHYIPTTVFQHQGAIFTVFIKSNDRACAQHALQVVLTLTFIIRIKSPIMLKFQNTNVNRTAHTAVTPPPP